MIFYPYHIYFCIHVVSTTVDYRIITNHAILIISALTKNAKSSDKVVLYPYYTTVVLTIIYIISFLMLLMVKTIAGSEYTNWMAAGYHHQHSCKDYSQFSVTIVASAKQYSATIITSDFV